MLGFHGSVQRPLITAPHRISQSRNRSLRSVATCAVKARWCLDVKYGTKMEAVALLQEWVQDIGSEAGLEPSNTAITSGSVGVPESRLELEVSFNSLDELEQFWASIPPIEHKIWSKKLQAVIVDGSPQWEIYRTVEPFPNAPPPPPTATLIGSLVLASDDDVGKYGGDQSERSLPSVRKETASGLAVVSSTAEVEEILDWKGDPMKINPGDRLPFKF